MPSAASTNTGTAIALQAAASTAPETPAYAPVSAARHSIPTVQTATWDNRHVHARRAVRPRKRRPTGPTATMTASRQSCGHNHGCESGAAHGQQGENAVERRAQPPTPPKRVATPDK